MRYGRTRVEVTYEVITGLAPSQALPPSNHRGSPQTGRGLVCLRAIASLRDDKPLRTCKASTGSEGCRWSGISSPVLLAVELRLLAASLHPTRACQTFHLWRQAFSRLREAMPPSPGNAI